MIVRFFYTCLLTLISPLLLVSLYKKKPGKPAIGKRWKEHFGCVPPLDGSDSSPIWIHAVSVGETLAVTPLVKQLHQRYPERKIVITTTTSTGAEQAAKLADIAEHRYMPFDFPFAVKRFIKTIHPGHLIIMETELWPNTLHLVHRAGIRVSVINARLSEKSCTNYQRIAPLFRQCHTNIDQILCQNPSDQTRFRSLGVAESKLSVTGSIKYDIDVNQATLDNAIQLRGYLGMSRPVWIAASTHQGEDEIILDWHQKLLTDMPDALLILVPRHPERFDSVEILCREQGLTLRRRTEQTGFLPPETQVYLADTMGEMLVLLGAADVCFMCGSLLGDKVGGHNVLEPAALGIPCLIGPSYFNFKDITRLLEQANALCIVDSPDKMPQPLTDLLLDSASRMTMSENAKQFVANNRGALERTLDQILHMHS